MSTFFLLLQAAKVLSLGLVQLESDELMSDIDAAIDFHSGEAQQWSTSVTSLIGGHGRMVPLDSTMALRQPCLPIFASMVVVAWFRQGADGARASPSAPRRRLVHSDVFATNPWLADFVGASRPALSSARAPGANVSDQAAGCINDVGVEHFSIVIRGGARAVAHVGAIVDGVRASASTVNAQEF